MIQKFKSLVLPTLAAVGFVLGLKTVFAGGQPPPVQVPLVEPVRSPFESYAAGAGLIEARSENIEIASPVGGVVGAVHVEVGAVVAAGEPLLTLDDREVKARLEVKRNGALVARARLAEAESQFALYRGVTDKRAVSAEEFNKRKFAAATAAAEVAAADAEVSAAETELERLTVRAPVAGRVLQVRVRVGEFAPAQVSATPLILLGDVSRLHVRVDIDENDAWRIAPGAQAQGYIRGNMQLTAPLTFVRFEPYVVPKRSLTGDSTERVDTRVLQIIYALDPAALPVFVGQLMDVFIEAAPSAGQGAPSGAESVSSGQGA
jgi:HlyD family secretion protein